GQSCAGGVSGRGAPGERPGGTRTHVCDVSDVTSGASGFRTSRFHRRAMSPFWISLRTAFTATAVTFIIGIAVARAMSTYQGRARALLDGILILPLVLPPTVVGFFLLLLFGRRSVVGHALEQIGITVAFSWPATVIAATVVAFPLMYRTALGAFEQ